MKVTLQTVNRSLSEAGCRYGSFTGTGTEEDPFVFLCSSAKGKVVATGGFLNKMAGFKADGTKEPGINGYWYQLEFHQNDTITNFADREKNPAPDII